MSQKAMRETLEFKEGWDAWVRGDEIAEVPLAYAVDSISWQRWRYGWMTAEGAHQDCEEQSFPMA